MIVYDKYSFNTQREIDPNGFLRVEMSNITKSQVRPYLGREIPDHEKFNLDPNKVYNVLCPKEELEKAAKTFNNLPLTREHIEVDVDDVPKEKIVGSLGDHATVDGKYLKNNLIIYDKKDIDLVLSGKKKELSCGYRYTPIRESGEYDGEHYDFKMTDIVGNHVALVKQGRAGRDVMVADSSKGLLETIKEKIMAVFDSDIVGDAEEKKEESSKETAVEKMYKKLSEQGMKGEALEQAIYEKHGWEGVEEARMISEYESGNPKHSQKEQEELVKSLEEELGDYKKIVKNFEDQGETGIDYNHYKQMVERQEGALKQAKSQLDWIKRHTKKEKGDLGSGSPRHIYGQKKDGSIAVALKTTNYPNWNKQEIVKEFDNEEDALNYAEERGETVKSDYQNKTKNAEKYGIATWVTPKELEHIKKHGRFPDSEDSTTNDEMSKEDKIGVVMKEFKDGELKSSSGEKVTDPKQAKAIALSEADKVTKDAIPEKQDEPKKAGEESALQQGEKKMAEEVKEEVKTEEKVETPAKDKPVEDACSKDAEIKKEESKKEEEVVEDEKEKDLKGKEQKAFAEGVDYGEKKEKEEPKKLDSEHESEGAKKADKEEKEKKEEMAKDSALVMDADALRAEGREQAIADFKCREKARKSVRSIVGDVDIFAFDSAEDIYKFACKEAGMNCDEIANFKDAFAGLQAGKGKLAMDASPVSGSDVECFKDIRLA